MFAIIHGLQGKKTQTLPGSCRTEGKFHIPKLYTECKLAQLDVVVYISFLEGAGKASSYKLGARW